MKLPLMNVNSKIFNFNVNNEFFELNIKNDKIVLMNKKLELGTINFEKSLEEVLIKNINFNYKLNNINITLIELNNNACIQIGKIGLSMYKSFSDFLNNTKENYSKNANDLNLITFYKY